MRRRCPCAGTAKSRAANVSWAWARKVHVGARSSMVAFVGCPGIGAGDEFRAFGMAGNSSMPKLISDEAFSDSPGSTAACRRILTGGSLSLSRLYGGERRV
jgi:hypothetical protein